MKKTPEHFIIAGLVLIIIAGFIWVQKSSPEEVSAVSGLKSASTTTVEPLSLSPTPKDTENVVPPTPLMVKPVATASTKVGRPAPELALPSGFSNSDAFKLQEVVGKKVILVSFESYTSKNSLRTIPYLNQWHQSYKNKGLFVMTVHIPRFAFDRSKSFVDAVAYANGAYFPIVLDNQFATARAWGNTEVPTHFLVDINGKIAGVYKGEGNYESIEARIRQLLLARSTKLKLPVDTYPAFETPKGVESTNSTLVKSVETFFGSTQNSLLGNGMKHLLGMQDMKPYTTVLPNTLYLSGSWEFTSDYAKSSIEKNSITYRYNAKNVYAVLGSLKQSKVRVTLDGQPLGTNAGKDIREEKGQSYLYVSEERLYNIVKGDVYGEHTIEMIVETAGLEAYALQFD
jgi:thiol-disulfide isomerase/thioredoxin